MNRCFKIYKYQHLGMKEPKTYKHVLDIIILIFYFNFGLILVIIQTNKHS
ncbi:hypothetical protein NARC_10098 [Candidatus Nitrosocosmicus arcticus]|uniref:Uncharacterized protein n=1 Tax=Candidatus Nitrosocosmicus arcticus TaxID=2035267 RepID=A0A557SYL9_9ARCH|nr:hypothetical protein NARC_10098 [Candidatus Nitrosocosmicus arcticus]